MRLFGLCGWTSLCQIRKISTTFLNRHRQKTLLLAEHKFRLRDNVANKYQLIYRAPMENYVIVAKNITTGSSVVIAILLAYQYAIHTTYLKVHLKLNFASFTAYDTDIWMFVLAFFIFNLALRLVLYRYPLRIYRDNNRYIAIYDFRFSRMKKHVFESGTVTKTCQKFNPWSQSTYRLGSRTSLILVDHFKTPSEFQKMFEYSKQR